MLNREALFAEMAPGIATASTAQQPMGLLVVRTQRMREFNLLFGYEAGERIAQAMQAALVAALRPVDRVLQIGECDFAVLLPDLRNREHATLAAAKLVRVLQEPLQAGDAQLLAAVAIGVALAPEHGNDPDSLCRHADSACDQAAASGEGVALYSTPDLPVAFAHADLRDAIAANRLQIYLQPIMGLQNGRTERAEALARWNHPQLGPIPPNVFVQVAEQTGLIGELTRWSLNLALRHAASARESHTRLGVSVNLSARVLRQHSFIEQVHDLVRLWNVPPATVVLEITESGLMEDLQHSMHLLSQLRDLGFGIAIDDFGTGYSSMAYLRRLPVTELKIDQSFIIGMCDDPRAEKLVGSMIDVSHHLGMSVVAEGVEEQATQDRLLAMGCDYAQGYHLGRPAPAEDLVAQLRQQAS